MIEIDQIYNEDCLEGMKRIDDASVDAVICDLPYEVLNDGNPDAQWDKMLPFDKLWEQWLRVCKPNAAIVLFAQGMFTADLMQSNRRMWRYNLVWDKVRTTGFLNANRMPLRCHEDICVFYRELPTYHPQMVKCLPYQRNHSRGKQEGEQTNRCYGSFGKADDYISDEKYPRSIIELANIVQNNEHPTQKSVDLLRYLVLTYTNPGDLVLDATIGSGTTAIACLKERRHFLGFELNKEYFDIAQRRIALERQQLQLDFNDDERERREGESAPLRQHSGQVATERRHPILPDEREERRSAGTGVCPREERDAVSDSGACEPRDNRLQLDGAENMTAVAILHSSLKPGDIDLLTYSTPCQSISQAGKREGMAKGSGTRSSVLWSTADAIEALRPKMLLQENVRAIINQQNIRHFRQWMQTVSDLGYENFLAPSFTLPGGERTTASILNARDYGIPQNRDRMFLVSIRKDLLRGALSTSFRDLSR